jgi:uncharacterized protein YndB with AHSA1/START domain
MLLLPVALAAPPAAAQNDPFYARVRGLTDRTFPSFQGFDCATVAAPREVVFRLLAAPDRAAQILLAGTANVLPRSASYRKERTAAKGETLVLSADTLTGPRRIELTVVAVVPGRLLSFVVTKDDQVLSRDVADLTDTFYLESNPDGTTDVYWANHWDPSSPFAAAMSPLGFGRRFRTRRELGLLMIEGLARAAASVPGGAPLPE